MAWVFYVRTSKKLKGRHRIAGVPWQRDAPRCRSDRGGNASGGHRCGTAWLGAGSPERSHGKPMENPWFTCFFIATNTVSSTDCRYVPLGGLLGKNFSPPCDAVQTNEGNVCLFQFPALVGQPDGGHFCDQRK